MNAPAENIAQKNLKFRSSSAEALNNDEKNEDHEDSVSKASSDFALKLVNSVKSMNNDEITHYELVSLFNSAEELKCLFLFIRALPYNPIAKIYPEAPFLFFKGCTGSKDFRFI